MGEKTGFMAVLFLFLVGVIPFLFFLFNSQVTSSKLLALSNEMNQLVVAEGDITPKVMDTVDQFEEKGVTIEFKDEDGNVINSRQNIGDKITIICKYNDFEVESHAFLTKRIN